MLTEVGVGSGDQKSSCWSDDSLLRARFGGRDALGQCLQGASVFSSAKSGAVKDTNTQNAIALLHNRTHQLSTSAEFVNTALRRHGTEKHSR